jgi:epoxyqueuosine reductase
MVPASRRVVASREETIAAAARRLGFPHVGWTPLAPLPRAAFLAGWLADGRAGDMAWLAGPPATRLDPRTRWPWARSAIVVAWPYVPPPPPVDWRATLTGRIAAYALGVDYHEVVRGRLRTLAQQLRSRLGGGRFQAWVDTGPLLEREWAMRAGLGWIGKHGLVIHRVAGSWALLGELLTDVALPACPLPVDRCGTCTRCLADCPTGALDAYAMDPRRCISYLTIEHHGAIDPALRPRLENWVFGCDVCQTVCPWNAAPPGPPTDALAPSLPALLALDDAGFRARFRRTPVLRTRRHRLARNAAVALGNSGNPDAVAPLARALADDPAPLVRAHAAWALGRLGGPAARAALARARATDPDAATQAEVAAALAALP